MSVGNVVRADGPHTGHRSFYAKSDFILGFSFNKVRECLL